MSIADVIAPESVTPSHRQLRDRFADLAEALAILKALEFARARMLPVLFNHVTRS